MLRTIPWRKSSTGWLRARTWTTTSHVVHHHPPLVLCETNMAGCGAADLKIRSDLWSSLGALTLGFTSKGSGCERDYSLETMLLDDYLRLMSPSSPAVRAVALVTPASFRRAGGEERMQNESKTTRARCMEAALGARWMVVQAKAKCNLSMSRIFPK